MARIIMRVAANQPLQIRSGRHIASVLFNPSQGKPTLMTMMKTRTPPARKTTAQVLLLTAAALPLQAQLTSHSFGSGGKAFTMDFVTIGNPGNLADTTGLPNPAGSVARTFQMGKYEVSEQMITKATALGSLGITKNTRGVDKPATSVSWNEAARFVNWLNTSQGHSPAYKFAVQPGGVGYSANANIQLWTVSDGAAYNAANPYRNANAVYFLPSENEWYKAAYYDPNKPGGAGYWDYPTGSDTAPTATSGSTTAGTAVYLQALGDDPADITLAGGLSPYGTMGQGGNIHELLEDAFDGVNDTVSEYRNIRGGFWGDSSGLFLESATGEAQISPGFESFGAGFRVAAVPEPLESAGVIGVAALGIAFWRRRITQ
jgi:sulfatase modifying factor 1